MSEGSSVFVLKGDLLKGAVLCFVFDCVKLTKVLLQRVLVCLS